MLPNTICTTLTAVPRSSGISLRLAVDAARAACPTSRRRRGRRARSCSRASCGNGAPVSASRRSRLYVSTRLREVVGGEVGVLRRRRARAFSVGERLLEAVAVDAVDDLAVHLDQPPVRVVARSARLPVARASPSAAVVVEAEVEDRVHHPGHRDRRARAHRDEQRVARVAEALAGPLLEARDVLARSRRRARRAARSRCQVGAAGVGRDREAGRDGDAELRHLGEADALAAEQLAAAVGRPRRSRRRSARPSRSAIFPQRPWRYCPTCRMRLRRIAVIGTASGNGKTTFGRALARPPRCSVRRGRRAAPRAGLGGDARRRAASARSSRSLAGGLGRRRCLHGASSATSSSAAPTSSSGSTCPMRVWLPRLLRRTLRPHRHARGALERQPGDDAQRALQSRFPDSRCAFRVALPRGAATRGRRAPARASNTAVRTLRA